MSNPAFVSGTVNSGSFTTGTSVTVTSTGSVTAGNLMIVVLTVGSSTSNPTALTPPDGTWTTYLATTLNVASGHIVTAIFTKRATTTGSFSGAFTWTRTAVAGQWAFSEWSNAGPALTDGAAVTTQNASGTNTSPSVTPRAGNNTDTLIGAIVGSIVGADTITIPGGMSTVRNLAGSTTQPFLSIASLALSGTGATGAKTWTVPTAEANLGISFLIQENPETNTPFFLGAFSGYTHNLLDSLRQNQSQAPQVETNIHSLGCFRATANTFNRALIQNAAIDVPAAVVQPETNPHFDFRYSFQANIHEVWLAYFMAPSDAPPAVEPNMHFLGRHVATAHTLLPAHRLHTDTAVPQHETNPHFLGRFTPTTHAQFRFGSLDTAIPQIETNVHTLGKFSPTTFTLLPLLRFNVNDQPAAPPQAETNTHFLGRFSPTSHVQFRFGSLDTAVPQVETNPHWLGRFTAPVHARFRYDIRDTTTPQVETNVHFLGRFTAPIFARAASSFGTSEAIVVVQPETNVSFLGRFTPTAHTLLPAHRLHTDTAVPQIETNTHFLGRFTAPTFARVAASFGTVDFLGLPPQSETNTHFLGRFTPTAHKLLPGNLQHTDTAVPQVETNTHWLGRFTPTTFARLAASFGASDPSVVAQPETNVHFLGRFTPTAHKLLPAHRLHTDTRVPQPGELLPSVLGTFSGYTHNLLGLLRQQFDLSQIPQPTPVHFLARFTPSQIRILPSLRQAPAVDFISMPQTPFAETNTHFLGRFRPAQHAILPAYRLQPDTTVQPSTNPHFLGRYTGATHANLPLLRQHLETSVTSTVIGAQPATDTHTLICFKATAHFVAPWLRQHVETSISILSPQSATNQHFLGRFSPTTIHTFAALRQNSATDFITGPQPTPLAQADPAWLGFYTGPVHSLFTPSRQHASSWVPQAETNTNFLGRFTATSFNLLPGTRQNQAVEGPQQAVLGPPETNVHWLGVHTGPVHSLFTPSRQNFSYEPQPETNTHFLGRFTPASFSLLPGTRQNQAVQGPTASVGPPETNVHWLGVYMGPVHSLFTPSRQNSSEAPPAETPTHFIGRFNQATIKILPGLRQNPAADFIQGSIGTPSAATNINFLGRFAPTRHSILPGLRQIPATDFIQGSIGTPFAETNTSFLGRFAPMHHTFMANPPYLQAIIQPVTTPEGPADMYIWHHRNRRVRA